MSSMASWECSAYVSFQERTVNHLTCDSIICSYGAAMLDSAQYSQLALLTPQLATVRCQQNVNHLSIIRAAASGPYGR